jgi:secreted trypsin-like serine protease
VGKVTGGRGFCTGTLVAPRAVLTAAHCLDPESTQHFELEGVMYTAELVIPHPGFAPDSGGLSYDDIGLVILKEAPNVAPSTISDRAVTVGLPVTLVGFGRPATTTGTLGTKRTANNVVDQVESKIFRFSGTGNGKGNTCFGDSGGPAFAMLGGREVVAGVTSTSDAECGVFTWDTRVDVYRSWLLTHIPDESPSLDAGVPDAGGLPGASTDGGATVSADATNSTDDPNRLQANGEPLNGGCATPFGVGSSRALLLLLGFVVYAFARVRR